MSKAVLVMNMPQNCFKCKLQDFATCRIANKCHVGDKRPDWCPLRELPEKKLADTDLLTMESGIVEGWNACLDKILK